MPKDYDAFVVQITKMRETEPNWTDVQLQSIRAPVLVVDGADDKAIKRADIELPRTSMPASASWNAATGVTSLRRQ